jgi:hypothetical protein
MARTEAVPDKVFGDTPILLFRVKIYDDEIIIYLKGNEIVKRFIGTINTHSTLEDVGKCEQSFKVL